MYSEIEKDIKNCVNECWKNHFHNYVVFLGKEYLVFFNKEMKKYICFKHNYENNLIEYLLNCGNALYVLNTEKIYYFSDKYIKENYLMKYESIIKS